MIRKYEQRSTHITRALQIYHILIGLAHNRQTIRYGELGTTMNYGAGYGSILGHPLEYIKRWCQHNELPALTSLVVEKESGLPSTGLPVEHIPAVHEKVFDYPWFSLFPPTEEDLEANRL